MRITIHADQHFQARGNHLLDQASPQSCLRKVTLGTVGDQIKCITDILGAFQAHPDATHVCLVENIRGGDLEHHRKADRIRDLDGLISGLGQLGIGDLEAVGAQDGTRLRVANRQPLFGERLVDQLAHACLIHLEALILGFWLIAKLAIRAQRLERKGGPLGMGEVGDLMLVEDRGALLDARLPHETGKHRN